MIPLFGLLGIFFEITKDEKNKIIYLPSLHAVAIGGSGQGGPTVEV
jgi:hypothetical protein